MADAIAAFKKALREVVAKDLRRVGFALVRFSNRVDPPPVVRLPGPWTHDPDWPRYPVFDPSAFLKGLPWEPPSVSEPDE